MWKPTLLALTLFLATTPFTHAQDTAFNNTTNFTGFTAANGGATVVAGNTITNLVADDITFDASFAGRQVTSFSFSVANSNVVDVSARARVRFYNSDGTGGGPGTYITGFTFNPITFTGTGAGTGNVGLYTATVAATSAFLLPTSRTMWAGITFDNNTGATGATAAQLNNLGQGIFNPPTVGSSADVAFGSTAPTSAAFVVNNPGGSTFNFGNATDPTQPVANFGWQFQVSPVPAPAGSASALIGLGVLAIAAIARRRRTAA